MKFIKAFFYYLIQFTWALPQNLLGAILTFTKYKNSHREKFFNSLISYHQEDWGGVSLGMFIITNSTRGEAWTNDTKVHEFGHSIQSLILGPFYLLVIGLPSTIWCNTKKWQDYRKNKEVSYFEFYPEKWANYLGSKITGLPYPKQ
ncbi:MAG: hypothetical protein WCR54_02565 [Clostridia bacterium]